MNLISALGLSFLLIFLGLILYFGWSHRKRPERYLRAAPSFLRLKRSIGMAVEAGQRLHITLGHGGVRDIQGASALIGLSILRRIARVASISDKPPIATSGEAIISVLSQDTLQSAFHDIGAENRYEPTMGQLSGLTPFSYAAGTLPVIYDQQVSVNIIAGHFSSEVALLTDAAERNGSTTLAGSDNIAAQALLYASSDEPLVGEELYASGAYIQAGPLHLSSVRTQDIFRWVIIAVILLGALLKTLGVM